MHVTRSQYSVVMCAFDAMFYHATVTVQPERREATIFDDRMGVFSRITSLHALLTGS